jgi:Fe-S-cluster containining protein
LSSAPGDRIECTKCGACCVAPDISSLGKPLGVRCQHLTAENLCAVYDDRPQICRDYQADWLCERIAAETLDQRVAKYLDVFELRIHR